MGRDKTQMDGERIMSSLKDMNLVVKFLEAFEKASTETKHYVLILLGLESEDDAFVTEED